MIAQGYESGGRDFWLNVQHGEIMEDMIRCDWVGSFDVKGFFDRMKEDYRSLNLIPCLGRTTNDLASRTPERSDEIDVEEVRAQTEHWGTDLDVQYVRQIYRKHGWPDAFRRDEATAAIDELMESMSERNSQWEPEFHWNEGSRWLGDSDSDDE